MKNIKLNIGAGDLHISGYLSLDLYNKSADIKSDIDDIPLEDNSVIEIIAYHVLEHVIPFKAEEGMVFQRIHDGMIFGNEIYLGMDYSTGEKRPDKVEYYKQIERPIVENINTGIGGEV